MVGKSLENTKSLDNLKEAFARESKVNRRYLYFARVADIDGLPDNAGLCKDTADAEAGHAFGHLASSRRWGIRPPASPWARRSSI
jgi:rubrerythrin